VSPSDEGTKKIRCDPAIKMNEVMLPSGKWMELEIILLSEIPHTERDKYHMFGGGQKKRFMKE
jgi:hypothetical protein